MGKIVLEITYLDENGLGELEIANMIGEHIEKAFPAVHNEDATEIDHFVKECGMTAEDVEDRMRRSFYDAATVALLQDLLMRSGEDAKIVREVLISTWKGAILDQHEKGMKMMEEMEGEFDSNKQDQFIRSMMEEMSTEFRSILSNPISFKRDED